MNKQSKTDKVFLIITIIVAILAVVLMIMSFSNAASFSDQLEKARENGMIVNNRKQIENAIATYTRNGILFAVLLVLFLFNSIMQMTSKMTITDFGVSGTFMGFTIFHKKVSLAFSEIRGVKVGMLLTVISDKGKYRVLAGNKKELAEIIKSNIK